MSNCIKTIKKARKQAMTRINDIQMRKHLNADALLGTMRSGFARIDDHRSDKGVKPAFNF